MTDKQTDKVKVEQVKVSGKNAYSVITQIVEKFNSSNGWAVKKVNMKMVNNLEVYLERSEKQSDNAIVSKTTKVETDVKAKEEVVEADKPPEKSDEVAVVKEADSGAADKPKQTRSTRSRTKK